MLLEELTMPEFEAMMATTHSVFVPVGSVEQHGPHLPLGTDAYLPQEIARRAAEHIDCVIAPPLHYGYKSRPLSGGGQGFVGTTSLRGKTYVDVTRDVVSEFVRHGFTRLAIVNWHMENSAFLYEGADLAMKEAPRSGAQILVITDAWPQFSKQEMAFLFPEGFSGWDVEHASVVETSMMMALFPELVRRDEIIDDASEEHPPYDILPIPPRIVSRSGVLSRATQASDAKGEFLVGRMVEHLIGVLRKEFPATWRP